MHNKKKIRPGDLVRFQFWSTYLAPGAVVDERGNAKWYELFPGDRGLVVAIDHGVTASHAENDIVIVMFARHNRLLRIHINQLERVDDPEG